jgi:hypothetical protein
MFRRVTVNIRYHVALHLRSYFPPHNETIAAKENPDHMTRKWGGHFPMIDT